MTGVGSAAGGRFSGVAVLAAGLFIGASSQAHAAYYSYYGDGEPFYYRPEPNLAPRRHKVRQDQSKKNRKPEWEATKPQGPLIVAISINQQRLKIYDANGVFAESPVSTGMRGHPTPMGVFSVIQKQKFHHSNIYSNAPMPYMQRITWSGVAMHAGVLPGYPASHGCIRMPMAFAVKMWNWTRMGARVVVTPGELTPASFAHALLPTQKVVPVAAIAPSTDMPVGAKASKGAPEASIADAKAADGKAADTKAADTKAANAQPALELKPTVGPDADVKAVTNDTPPSSRERTRTADASDMPASQMTMSDASSGSPAPQHQDGAAKSETITSESAKHETVPKAQAQDSAPKPDDKNVAENKPAEPAATAPVAPSVKASDARREAAKPEAGKADAAASGDKPAQPANAAASVTDAKPDRDQARPADAAREATKAAKTEPPRRAGQIAVFISRKDFKLYVRQNFSPLFEVPVTIAPGDRPLGTHVFTADVDKTNTNLLHWSVVTIPVSMRSAARANDEEHSSRRRKNGAALAEAKPILLPDTPSEALDRISIPVDAMARVTEALTTGGSIIVSDQGINQGETGEGTDFIVSLR